MGANDHLLSHLCQEEDTLKEAKLLLRQAQKKTGPGSGYELGPHTTGLPAICALLASQKLNNADVTEKAAQMASCLKASDFNKALAIVRAAVGGPGKEIDPRKIYDHLLSKYGCPTSPQRFKKWFKEAGETVQAEDKKLNPDDPSHGKIVKCAIFFWTYESATGRPPTPQKDFAEEQSIQPRTFTRILNKIAGLLPLVKSRIAKEVAGEKTASPTKAVSTPRHTPRKQVLRELPSRDTPSKRKLEETLEQHEERASGSQPSQAADIVPETPTKRPRTASPLKPRVYVSQTKARAVAQPLRASSPENVFVTTPSEPIKPTPTATTSVESRASTPPILDLTPSEPDTTNNVVETIETIQKAVDSPEKQAPPNTKRRFRPVYLDTAQWYSTDERIGQKILRQERVC